MFHIHGTQGHVFSGTLEQLRLRHMVGRVARVPRTLPVVQGAPAPVRQPVAATAAHAHPGASRELAEAYGQAPVERARLRCAADVMHTPVVTVAADHTLRQAWQVLAEHGLGQAPVVDATGALVGLLARAELLPRAAPGADAAADWRAHLDQPVRAAMWSPVPSAAPGTDLRRVAALLLDTGLPGLPVADEAGAILGFVARSDLLRALATDPPLDLWG